MTLSRKLLLPALLALSPLLAAQSFADALKADGFKYSDEVTVIGIKDGQLEASVKGADKTFDLDKVEWIELKGQPKFNEAEQSRKDAKAAAALYKAALRNINDRKLKPLAQLRTVGPYDADGQFTEAVTLFLDVYVTAPTESIWKLHPTNLPAPPSSTMLKQSADIIKAKLASFKSLEAQKNLKTFQLDLLTKANDPAAAALAKEIGSGGAEPAPAPAAVGPANVSPESTAAITSTGLQGVSDAVKARNYDNAITQADNLLKTATGDTAVRLYELKAQALEGQKKYDEASATLLRVLAHYPSNPNVIPDIQKAADLQKLLKHDDEAKRLTDEITAIRKAPKN